jgi:hypothetical protein
LQQQQPPQQQKQVGLSQVIKQIAQQVANANPDTNATQIQQVLVQLAKQTAQTASKEQAIQEIQQISSQIAKFPYGTVSQSLAHFAGQLVSASSSGRADTGTTNIMQIAQQIAQEKVSSGGNVSQSVVNKAIQTATGANSNNINQHIKQTAQIISKQTGVPVEKVEAIIIQMALQIAQAQGKDITGQSIFQIANQIAKNPNGIYTQLILLLVKQDSDDGGKNGHTVKIIKTVVRGDEDDSSNGERSNNQSPKQDTNPNLNRGPSQPTSKPKEVSWNTPEPPSGVITKLSVVIWKDPTGQVVYKVNPNVRDKATVNKELSEGVQQLKQQPKQTTTPITPGAPTPTPTISPSKCFICAVGNAVDNQRVNNIAVGTAQITGVSAEANQLALSDALLRTANEAGPGQVSQALTNLEANAADPNSLKKLGDLAKLYESGNDIAANQASDSLADKLSTGADLKTALAETAVPDPASVAATGGASPLAGETTAAGASPLAGETTAAGETTENDGELADDDAEDEDEPSIEDDAGDDDDSDSEDEGATADEEEVAASDESDDDAGDDDTAEEDEGDDSSDDGGGDGGDGDDGGGDDGGGDGGDEG